MDGTRPPFVLLVDDFPESIDPVRDALEAAGVVVHVAVDGQDAIERLAVMPADVIVLDFAMPRLDGVHTTRALKQNPKTAHIPVVMFSALAGTELAYRASEEGCVLVVRKPEGSMTLVHAVLQLLGRQLTHNSRNSHAGAAIS